MSSSTYLLYELALHSMLTRLAGKTAVIQKAEVILCQLPAKIDEPPWFNVPSIWINLWGMGEGGRHAHGSRLHPSDRRRALNYLMTRRIVKWPQWMCRVAAFLFFSQVFWMCASNPVCPEIKGRRHPSLRLQRWLSCAVVSRCIFEKYFSVCLLLKFTSDETVLKAQVIDDVMFRYCPVDSREYLWVRKCADDAATGVRLMYVGMLLLYSHVKLMCLLQWWTSQLQTDFTEEGLQKLYIHYNKKKQKKKKCMRIRCLQIKVKGLL